MMKKLNYIDKLKKRDDIDGYHVFNWVDGKQLL